MVRLSPPCYYWSEYLMEGAIVLMKFSIQYAFQCATILENCSKVCSRTVNYFMLCRVQNWHSSHAVVYQCKYFDLTFQENLFGSMCYDNHTRHMKKNRSVVLQSGILAYEHFKISRKCFKTICLFEITHQTTMLKPFGSQKVSYGTKVCLCDWVRVMRSSSCLFC